jgi:hypothetical protein
MIVVAIIVEVKPSPSLQGHCCLARSLYFVIKHHEILNSNKMWLFMTYLMSKMWGTIGTEAIEGDSIKASRVDWSIIARAGWAEERLKKKQYEISDGNPDGWVYWYHVETLHTKNNDYVITDWTSDGVNWSICLPECSHILKTYQDWHLGMWYSTRGVPGSFTCWNLHFWSRFTHLLKLAFLVV